MKLDQRFATLIVIALTSLVARGAAQELQAAGDADELEVIGWYELRVADIPAPKYGTQKPSGRRLLRFEERLAAQRADAIKALVGRDFYGLCEVVRVVPMKGKKRTLDVIAWERRDLDEASRVGALTDDVGGWRLVQVRIALPQDEAKEFAPAVTFNVSGVIEEVTVKDWQVLFDPFGEKE
jgi:hypothetical protein